MTVAEQQDECQHADRLAAEIAGRLAKHGLEEPFADARRIVQAGMGLSRESIARGDLVRVTHHARRNLHDLTERRIRREPIAYLRGRCEFYGLDLVVTRDTLIPRPETELLVEAVLGTANAYAAPRILDACTGSGCVLIALAMNCPSAECIGCDLSADALAVAARNRERHGLERVRLFRGDMLGAVRPSSVDIITANPPYVRPGDIAHLQPEIRLHEPRLALDGGPDGLGAFRAIARQAIEVLTSGGMLAVEIGAGQQEDVSRILLSRGFVDVAGRMDLAGTFRVITAKKPKHL